MAESGSRFWQLIVVVLMAVAIILGFFGVIFIIASTVQETATRLLIGGVFTGTAVVIGLGGIWVARAKVRVQYTVKAQLDLPANFDLKGLQCKSCGAPISKDMVTWNRDRNSVTVHCQYCNTVYEIVENVRW